MSDSENKSKIMDYATKGAVIAVGVGVAAGAVLSLLTWAPGFIVASLTLGVVINGSLGAMIGAGIGFLSRNEKKEKPNCGPNVANHVVVDKKEEKEKQRTRMEQEEKVFEEVQQEKAKQEQYCAQQNEEKQCSTRFQDKVCDARTVEVMQR